MILASFGLIMLNIISYEAITGESGENVAAAARCWVIVSLLFLFIGFGIAVWCLIEDLSTPNGWHWGGIFTLLSNLMILTAAFLFRLTRRSGDHAI